LPADVVAGLRAHIHAQPGAALTVDLQPQTVSTAGGASHRFEVDPFRKEMLLAGRDEIGLTLGFETKIREFEARHAREMAWVVPRMASTLLEVTHRSRGINYGSNKVRFISPVPAGARIRVRQRIVGAEEVTGNGVRVTSEMSVEIEGQPKPALIGELIGVRYA